MHRFILRLALIVGFLPISRAMCAQVIVPADADSIVVKIERPEAMGSATTCRGFNDMPPAWLPLRIAVALDKGRPVTGVAFAAQFNASGHEVDVDKLRIEQGRLKGEVVVTLHWGEIQSAMAFSEDKRIQAGAPKWADGTRQTIVLDTPIAQHIGAPNGTASWPSDVTDPKGKILNAPAQAWNDPGIAPGQAVNVELHLGTFVGPKERKLTKCNHHDGMHGSACLLLRTTFHNGKARAWTVLQAPERYNMDTADLLWKVEASEVSLSGRKLTGKLTLKSAVDKQMLERLKSPIQQLKFEPFPDGLVSLDLSCVVAGRYIAGSATVAVGGAIHSSRITGAARGYPFAVFADRTPANALWKLDRQSDPALVAQAVEESLVPIRPGEPGKREFWSEYADKGACSIYLVNGKKMVWFTKKSPGGNSLEEMPLEDFWAARPRPNSGPPAFIAAPSLNLAPIPGAERYRLTAYPSEGQKSKAMASVEVEQPWKPLAELWKKLPVSDQRWDLAIEGLNAQGSVVPGSGIVRLAIKRKSPFQGPYSTPPRSYREGALMLARWIRDNPRYTDMRGLSGEQVGSGAGDYATWFISYAALYAGQVLYQLSPDPVERADALDLSLNVADVWRESCRLNVMPDVYQTKTCDMFHYGLAWLDMYRLSGDPVFRDLALLLAQKLAQRQESNGVWGPIAPESGKVSRDEKTGRPVVITFHQPGLMEYDPSSILYFLGRLRKELKVNDFAPTEAKAWAWLEANSIARFDWRREGPGEGSQHMMPSPTVGDLALRCFDYLDLDLPDRPADVALMTDLLRWCEDRHVDWSRKDGSTLVYPRMFGRKDEHLRLADAYARLAVRTKNALHRAKAEALATAALVAQNAVSGQLGVGIYPSPELLNKSANLQGSGDGGLRGEYSVLSLMRLAQLWESGKTDPVVKP